MTDRTIKRIKYLLAGVLVLLGAMACTVRTYAETREIINIREEQDLVVNFIFDTEIVDITLVGPDGKRYTKDSSEVKYSSGELWATYMIPHAGEGKWSVDFERGRNEKIDYSIIDSNLGLGIQYFNVDNIGPDSIDVSFRTDFADNSDSSYKFEITAKNENDPELSSIIAYGSSRGGEEVSTSIDTSKLISGDYSLEMYAYIYSDKVEIFDRLSSEIFSYVNQDNENKTGDFVASVDLTNSVLSLDWSNSGKHADEYKAVIKAGDDTIYSESLKANDSFTTIYFPEDADRLSISLYGRSNYIWSEPSVKDINLKDEYLRIDCDEYTSEREIPISYKTSKARELTVSLNGESGVYSIDGEDTLYLDISEESNMVEASFESDDNLIFCVKRNVTLDMLPPEIELYDNVDGKTIKGKTFTVLGKITGGDSLTINDVDVPIGEGGVFSYEIPVASGQNVININAKDACGLSSLMVLTVYGDGGVFSGFGTESLLKYLPLLIALGVSLIIIVSALLFMKKKDKDAPKTYNMVGIILWDILLLLLDAFCIFMFLIRTKFSRTIKYIELAEKSIKDASNYLLINRILLVASIVLLLLFILSVFITVRRGAKRREYKKL